MIAKEEYFRLTGTLTVCVLTLANGFTVTGESACASPENFNEEIGNRIARNNAKNKIWALEGYLLRQRLHEDEELGEIELKIKPGTKASTSDFWFDLTRGGYLKPSELLEDPEIAKKVEEAVSWSRSSRMPAGSRLKTSTCSGTHRRQANPARGGGRSPVSPFSFSRNPP